MVRVQLATLAWGQFIDGQGQPRVNLTATIKNLDGSTATTWSAVTGGTSTATSLTTGVDGALPRFIEEGTYTLEVGAQTWRVEAVAGPQDVTFYGAVGGDVGDQTDAFNAAILAVARAGGGVVSGPQATYRFTDEIVYPTGVPIRLEFPRGTVFHWPTDLGADKWAIRPYYDIEFPFVSAVLGDNDFAEFEGFELRGPGGTAIPTPGVAPAVMHGLRLERWCTSTDNRANGFWGGITFYGSHQKVFRPMVICNHVNIYYETTPVGDQMDGKQGGHQLVVDGDCRHAALATRAIGDKNSMYNSVWRSVQRGFSPYITYRFTSPGGGVTCDLSTDENCNDEQIGNAVWGCEDMNTATDLIRSYYCRQTELSRGDPGPGGGDEPSRAFNSAFRIADQNKKQSITVANATGGTFTLLVKGVTTAGIARNAPATGVGSVQAAIETALGIGAGTGPLCTGGPLGTAPVVVEFAGIYAAWNIARMVPTSSLTGVGATVTVTVTQPAHNQDFAVHAGRIDESTIGPGSLVMHHPGRRGVYYLRGATGDVWDGAADMIDALTNPGGDGTIKPVFVPHDPTVLIDWDTNRIHAKGNVYRIIDARGTWSAGDLIQFYQVGSVVDKGIVATTGVACGFAIEASTTTDGSQRRLLLCRGKITVSPTGTIATGIWVKHDTAGTGKVITATGASDGHVVAHVIVGNAGVAGNPIDIRALMRTA